MKKSKISKEKEQNLPYSLDEIVWVKFMSYPWWPGHIYETPKENINKKYLVVFLNDKFEHCLVDEKHIKKYHENDLNLKETYLKQKNIKNYKQLKGAFEEAEKLLIEADDIFSKQVKDEQCQDELTQNFTHTEEPKKKNKKKDELKASSLNNKQILKDKNNKNLIDLDQTNIKTETQIVAEAEEQSIIKKEVMEINKCTYNKIQPVYVDLENLDSMAKFNDSLNDDISYISLSLSNIHYKLDHMFKSFSTFINEHTQKEEIFRYINYLKTLISLSTDQYRIHTNYKILADHFNHSPNEISLKRRLKSLINHVNVICGRENKGIKVEINEEACNNTKITILASSYRKFYELFKSIILQYFKIESDLVNAFNTLENFYENVINGVYLKSSITTISEHCKVTKSMKEVKDNLENFLKSQYVSLNVPKNFWRNFSYFLVVKSKMVDKVAENEEFTTFKLIMTDIKEKSTHSDYVYDFSKK